MSSNASAYPSKTSAQVRRIFGLARARGLDEAELHTLVSDATTKTSIAALNITEADAVISRLGGEPLAARRTLQYRRRKAGVSQVVQHGQLELIAKLASQRHWSAAALVEFCRRQCGHHPLRTTADANKVIEALKSMNRREGLWA